MKPKNDNITVTATELCRLTGLSRERVASALAGVEPASSDRRTSRYLLNQVLPAIITGSESPRERTERLRGDILEIKRQRMLKEQLDYSAVRAAWLDVLLRVKSYIENCHLLTRPQAAEITKQLHAEITGAEAEIEACVFAADSGDTDDDETDEEA